MMFSPVNLTTATLKVDTYPWQGVGAWVAGAPRAIKKAPVITEYLAYIQSDAAMLELFPLLGKNVATMQMLLPNTPGFVWNNFLCWRIRHAATGVEVLLFCGLKGQGTGIEFVENTVDLGITPLLSVLHDLCRWMAPAWARQNPPPYGDEWRCWVSATNPEAPSP